MQYIECYNLNLHNLKSINLKIPKNKCTVITGVSGSGKSTFVFDILDKVAQTKYLSAINMIPDKDVISEFDIRGLSPTVCVSQNLKRQTNPRSTVEAEREYYPCCKACFPLLENPHQRIS